MAGPAATSTSQASISSAKLCNAAVQLQGIGGTWLPPVYVRGARRCWPAIFGVGLWENPDANSVTSNLEDAWAVAVDASG